MAYRGFSFRGQLASFEAVSPRLKGDASRERKVGVAVCAHRPMIIPTVSEIVKTFLHFPISESARGDAAMPRPRLWTSSRRLTLAIVKSARWANLSACFRVVYSAASSAGKGLTLIALARRRACQRS